MHQMKLIWTFSSLHYLVKKGYLHFRRRYVFTLMLGRVSVSTILTRVSMVTLQKEQNFILIKVSVTQITYTEHNSR